LICGDQSRTSLNQERIVRCFHWHPLPSHCRCQIRPCPRVGITSPDAASGKSRPTIDRYAPETSATSSKHPPSPKNQKPYPTLTILQSLKMVWCAGSPDANQGRLSSNPADHLARSFLGFRRTAVVSFHSGSFGSNALVRTKIDQVDRKTVRFKRGSWLCWALLTL
jgi:hypothetical protein